MLSFEFRWYRRPFRQPLRTRYGLWSIREGILVRLTDAETGGQGYGEIAPIPWLGSETVEEALAFCQQLPPELSEAEIEKIPATLPATRFGLECAWLACRDPGWLARDLSGLSWCGLLGKTAPADPYPAYKVKVGVEPLEQEVKKLESWLEQLPAGSCLRLDANGGLSLEGARRWLALCDRINQEWPGKIEFFEQPLPPAQHADLSRLSWEFQTPIALDESVVGLEQLQAVHQAGWKGILVVKPSLVGSCLALRDYLRQHPSLDLAFSSALETPIGAWHGLVWAGSLQAKSACPRAVGWGVREFFQEGDPLTLITLSAQGRAALMQAVWERHSQP